MILGCLVGLVVQASVELSVLQICDFILVCGEFHHRVPDEGETILFRWTLWIWALPVMRLRVEWHYHCLCLNDDARVLVYWFNLG